MERSAPFDHLPSGVEIGRYFWHETERQNPGCDGIDLYRSGNDYCYLWVHAFVDLDMWHAYLLEIRTHVGVTPGEFGETRDYLFLSAGAGDAFAVQWHNQPISFDAENFVHRDRFRAGMDWFARLIEETIDDFETSKDGER